MKKKSDKLPKKLSTRVRRLRGIIKVDKDLNYKEILIEELRKKYGK